MTDAWDNKLLSLDLPLPDTSPINALRGIILLALQGARIRGHTVYSPPPPQPGKSYSSPAVCLTTRALEEVREPRFFPRSVTGSPDLLLAGPIEASRAGANRIPGDVACARDLRLVVGRTDSEDHAEIVGGKWTLGADAAELCESGRG